MSRLRSILCLGYVGVCMDDGWFKQPYPAKSDWTLGLGETEHLLDIRLVTYNVRIIAYEKLCKHFLKILMNDRHTSDRCTCASPNNAEPENICNMQFAKIAQYILYHYIFQAH